MRGAGSHYSTRASGSLFSSRVRPSTRGFQSHGDAEIPKAGLWSPTRGSSETCGGGAGGVVRSVVYKTQRKRKGSDVCHCAEPGALGAGRFVLGCAGAGPVLRCNEEGTSVMSRMRTPTTALTGWRGGGSCRWGSGVKYIPFQVVASPSPAQPPRSGSHSAGPWSLPLSGPRAQRGGCPGNSFASRVGPTR